jgi:hypothetical protein
MSSWVGVSTIGFTTFGVALLASYLVVSQGSWILSRLRDDMRCDARRRDGWRRFYSVLSCGLLWFMYIVYGILNPHRHDRHRDARRRFASVFSCAFTKLMYATNGMFCRRLDARCPFVSIVSHGVSMLLLAWFGIEVGVATVVVATLSVSSSMSCRWASRGSSTIHIWNHLSASRQ